MRDSLWEPDPPGVLWTYSGHGFSRKSIRNDALWAAIVEVRNRNLIKARAWCAAAVADGWTIEPTYPGHEPVETAWRLSRAGFSVQGLSRPEADRMTPCASVHIWGPDALQIKPPPVYDWDAIVRGSRTCTACGAQDVDTQRYSFAGRCCAACRPEMARQHEQGNWTE